MEITWKSCQISLTIFHLFYDFIWSNLTYLTLLSSLPSQLTVLPYAIYLFFGCLEKLTLLFLQVGNAAYHNDMLYEELKRSIPQLTKILISKEEDKTKANAAGALSNLVRNSNRLCEDIISAGAMQVCFDMILVTERRERRKRKEIKEGKKVS